MVDNPADPQQAEYIRAQIMAVFAEIEKDASARFSERLAETSDQQVAQFDTTLNQIADSVTQQLERELSNLLTKALGGGANARAASNVLASLSTDILSSVLQGGGNGSSLDISSFFTTPGSFNTSNSQQGASLASAISKAGKNF